jgi:hypothetical protein
MYPSIPRNMLSATSVIWFRSNKLSRMGSNKWLGTRLHNSLIFFEPNLVASSARTCWQRASKDGISNISLNVRDTNNMVNRQRICHLWIPSSDKNFNKPFVERCDCLIMWLTDHDISRDLRRQLYFCLCFSLLLFIKGKKTTAINTSYVAYHRAFTGSCFSCRE